MDPNGQVVETALRLLDKARSMQEPIAAEYLTPLISMAARSTGEEGANARAAISELVVSLRRGTGTTPDTWARAIMALEIWHSSLGE